MTRNTPDIRGRLGLRPVVNVSGTMTSLGASICVPEAVEAVAAILPEFVDMSDLHAKASAVIARLTGAEAGTVTASTSSGVTLAVAACMTGDDRARIERLPDTAGMKDEVVIQLGHMVNYGAPLDQAIRLAGSRVVPVGQATDVRDYQLEGALGDRTAAAVYVVSHHTVQYGHIPLAEFARICHGRGVPVIVDAASEYDLRGFLAAGADLAACLADHFGEDGFVTVAPFEPATGATGLDPQALNGSNRMRLHVFANDQRGQALLVAVYDNLGKGASGAAVQNLNIMIGADQAIGLDLPIAA